VASASRLAADVRPAWPTEARGESPPSGNAAGNRKPTGRNLRKPHLPLDTESGPSRSLMKIVEVAVTPRNDIEAGGAAAAEPPTHLLPVLAERSDLRRFSGSRQLRRPQLISLNLARRRVIGFTSG